MSTEQAFATYVDDFCGLARALDSAPVAAACDAITAAFVQRRCLFACGNGGSAATASHFIEDSAKLMWRPASDQRLRAQALTDATACITALANDDGYEQIFAIQLAQQASRGDVLVLISGSGHSPNVLAAAHWARTHGLVTVGLTGYDGGQLAGLCDIHVHVASHNMGMLEGVHMLLLDFISKEVRHRAYGTGHADR